MEDDSFFTKKFIDAVKKPKDERTSQEVDYLCHILKKLSEFQTFDNPALRGILDQLVYEHYSEETTLYIPGDQATCWYYILNGSVLISTSYIYSSGCSFGQCVDTNFRTDTCLVTDQSELLRVNYTEKELSRFIRRTKASGSVSLTNSIESGLTHSVACHDLENPTHPVKGDKTRKPEPESLSDGELLQDDRPPHKVPVSHTLSDEWNSRDIWDIEKLDPLYQGCHGNDDEDEEEIDINGDRRRLSQREGSHSYDCEHFRFDESTIKTLSGSNDSLYKAVEEDPIHLDDDCKDVSETEVRLRDRKKVANRRSAPPSTQRSLRDSVGSLDYLSESHVDVDSEDEESVQSETSSSPGMDSVYEVLNKPPVERTEEDIERVMDVLQYMPAFANMTSNIRRALFKVLLLIMFPDDGSVVIENGEQVNKWFVVLHGQLRLVRDVEQEKTFHIGECFGVSKSLKVLPHRGRLVTASKDCQLCYVSSEEYGQVLAQGEENLKRVEENGEVVAVLEKRAINAKREGYFVVQATPTKLLDYLVEEGVDDTFHTDFLLTYRSFLDSIDPIVEKIKSTWIMGVPEQRERLTLIVLNWVSEHFSDFENNIEFLDWFEGMLIEDGKIGVKRMLDEARIANAKSRIITLERDGINSPLGFSVIGGWELAQPIFVSEVTLKSQADQMGLKIGDEILSINDTKCEQKELRDVMNILQKNYKLEMTVRSNMPKYKQFCSEPRPELVRAQTISSPASGFNPLIIRSNSTSASSSTRVTKKGATSAPTSDPPKSKKRAPGFLKPIVKTLSKSSMEKFKSRLRHQGSSEPGSESPSGPLKARKKLGPRKASEENLLDDSSSNGKVLRPTTSADDLTLIHVNTCSPKQTRRGHRMSRSHVIDSVVKLYATDHSVKYFDVTLTTTVAELIDRGVKEFYPDRFVASPSDEFCICMVTVQSRSGPIKNSVLPGHLTDLANSIGLESRYYLKERAYHGTLVQDEEAERIVKESRQWEMIYNLKAMQVAEELTKQDSEVFSSIGPSEYIADLWKNSETSRHHLIAFENIPNDEMYWVITSIVTETNTTNRAKIIRHFIKIAKCCKILKNYNTMFHILSGLNHGLVQRLRSSWEKVPHRYKKTMDDLLIYMNPFHNMAKYRELQRNTKAPLIPFFPIIKKDLTFLFDGNDTIVNGLINFEKLRMLSHQIRVVKGFCSQPILPTPPDVDLSQLGVLNRTFNSLHGSLRWKQRSPSHMVSLTENALKRVYVYNHVSKMVRKHLLRKYVLQDESILDQIVDSQEKLSNVTRRNPPSPLNKGKKTLLVEAKHRSTNISPSPTTNSLGSDTPNPDLSVPPVFISTATTNLSALLSPSVTDDSLFPTRSSSVNSFTSNNSAPAK